MRRSVNPAATQVGQNQGGSEVSSALGDIPRPNRSSGAAMSADGHADAGNVTQDDDTQAGDDYDDGLDDGHQTDTDPEVRAESIRALRRADQILIANGRGSRAERKAARGRGEEGEGVAVGEGDSLLIPQEDLEASQPPDPAINQFLAAAPSKPEVLGKDAWPGAVQIPKRLTAKEKECVRDANMYLSTAVETGKRIYEKARRDHLSFLSIIKSGAAALTIARKEKTKAELNLKKAQAAAAKRPDYDILKLSKEHADEIIQRLEDARKKSEKTIEKLEKRNDELEKEVKKSAKESQEDAVAIHCQKKEIDLDAFAAKKNLEKRMQEKKEANKKKTKSKRFDDATMYQSGGSFSGRLGKIHKDSEVSSSSDDSVCFYLLRFNQFNIF